MREQVSCLNSTVESVATEARGLPSEGRALLVERLRHSRAGDSDPAVERANLAEVRRRREAVRNGAMKLIEGDEALRRARTALGE